MYINIKQTASLHFLCYDHRLRRITGHPATLKLTGGEVGPSSPSSFKNPILQNFTFPPNLPLNWGHQRFPRCSNPNPSPNRNPNSINDDNPNRPWNLRSRRNPVRVQSPPSPSTAPAEEGRGILGKLARLRAENGGERSKFLVGLSREEIEEDFVAMKGSKPPRRPKKRAKYVHRKVDSVFPGLWLSEMTADLYKIDESNLAV